MILVFEFDQFLTSLCFHPVLGLYHCCESLKNHRFQFVPVYDNHPILVCLHILYISYIHVHVFMCVTLLVLIVSGADLEVYNTRAVSCAVDFEEKGLIGSRNLSYRPRVN